MIVVKNTKELEEKYDLSKIPDEEKVVVLGGFAGKEKYNSEKYRGRVTYPARQIKQIINQMKEIESSIPSQWNEWQKAKYIYEVLGKNIGYNFNEKEYASQQCSNLSVLLSRKAICAGYSILYKEMMDRQNIECDYVRGYAVSQRDKKEKHAWNVLSIKGANGERHTFPIDLTWDSGAFQRGETQLKYFGCKEDFFKTHNPDKDEKMYNFMFFTPESINAIDTTNYIKQSETNKQEKIIILQKAIEETYKKFKDGYGEEEARSQVHNAIIKYIQEGQSAGLTRQNGARDLVITNINPEEMREILINQYIENIELLNNSGISAKSVLGAAIQDTGNKYGKECMKDAIKSYLIDKNILCFTRDNQARNNMQQFMTPELALDEIVHNFVEKEINLIEQIEQNGKRKFSADELAQVQLPKEESIVKKAMEWIKNRLNNRTQNQQNQIYEENDRAIDVQNERE